jgi:hypothetical protein
LVNHKGVPNDSHENYIENTIPVIPLLPCFDRFLVIGILERKKGVDVGEEIYLIR